MNEARATRYQRLKRRADVLIVLASGALWLALILSGGSAAFRTAVASASAVLGESHPAEPWVVVGVFTLGVFLLHEVVTFPAVAYRAFLLERRYGLTTQRGRLWLRDHAKAVVLGAVLAVAAAEAVYAGMRAWPNYWWLAAAGVFTMVALLVMYLLPVALLPVFYRFSPLRRESLQQRLQHLAARAGTRVAAAYEWKLGDRTCRATAALVGVGRTRRILLSDTLLERYSDDEIEMVLAHEMGHQVHRDVWRALAYEAALMLLAFLAAHLALLILSRSLVLQGVADVAGLPVVVAAVLAVSLMMAPVINAAYREQERRADRFALELAGNPEAFVSVMRRLAAQNLVEDRPSRMTELLWHTHPALEDRVAMARAWHDESRRRGTEGPRRVAS